MDSKTEYPEIVTEIHRYSKPEDMWAFHSMVPDDTYMWNVQPFAPNSYDDFPDSPTYRETGINCKYTEEVGQWRLALLATGHVQVAFKDLPKDFRRFVTHQQAPLEWHGRLDDDDPETTERVVVWVKGELPT